MKTIKLSLILAVFACMAYNAQAQCIVSRSFPCHYATSNTKTITWENVMDYGTISMSETVTDTTTDGNLHLMCDYDTDGYDDCGWGGNTPCGWTGIINELQNAFYFSSNIKHVVAVPYNFETTVSWWFATGNECHIGG